jgi:phage terminase small subunit
MTELTELTETACQGAVHLQEAIMTRKQQRFVKEYLTDFNATQAAIRAGYSRKGASVQGVRLLANAKVQAEVVRKAKKRDQELDLDNDRILRRLAEIAFSTSEETRDALRALDILCKTRGMYAKAPTEEEQGLIINLHMGDN